MCSPKGRLTSLGMKKITGGRHVYDAEYRRIIFQQCQGNRPNRNSRLEIIHAVDGIEDPQISFFIVSVCVFFIIGFKHLMFRKLLFKSLQKKLG